jgi:predicted dehydrogenase/threonine dehydrogenase-like Zn-dependent dehydrogenase
VKQVLQDARTGDIAVTDVPAPQLLPGCVLVRVAASLVSAGTERAASEFAGKSLLQKARSRPDLVRQVWDKVQRDGVIAAIGAVRSRLGAPLSPGYSSAGTVTAVDEGVTGFRVGDRVACAGAGFASHAEMVCIPQLLAAVIPSQEVSFDEAAFSTLGAVALHGIRTAEAQLGDTVAVIGLGLLGQLTVQILKAAGCRVLGLDLSRERAELAERMGADVAIHDTDAFADLCAKYTAAQGVDSVLITAETSSSDLVNLAGQIARQRAIVAAVGTVGMDIQRKLYYEKELNFRISRSYGPGRYDAAYEQKGRDYPIGYVRWTETRNMAAFLQLLADRKVDVKPLITHRFPVEQAEKAYELILGRAAQPFLGVLLQYAVDAEPSQRCDLSPSPTFLTEAQAVTVGVLGAGVFATNTLLPVLKRSADTALAGICAVTGHRSQHAARKFGFRYCTTDENEIFRDGQINTVVIATRHHLHSRQVLSALDAGKHVFCEKPLCLREEDLAEIIRSQMVEHPAQRLMVGFNRRFAPLATRMKAFASNAHEPLIAHYRVNAGALPPDHWLKDPEEGGGRLLGEACHFIDFLTFLAGAFPVEVSTRQLSPGSASGDDNFQVVLRFANGSEGTITYLANGDRSFSKERVEVFAGGSVAVLDDFRSLELVRNGKRAVIRSRWKQDKGHAAEWAAFARCIRDGQPSPIMFEETVAVTLATLRALESCQRGEKLSVDTDAFMQQALTVKALAQGGGNTR